MAKFKTLQTNALVWCGNRSFCEFANYATWDESALGFAQVLLELVLVDLQQPNLVLQRGGRNTEFCGRP